MLKIVVSSIDLFTVILNKEKIFIVACLHYSSSDCWSPVGKNMGSCCTHSIGVPVKS